MKKKIMIALICVMAAATVLGGCGKKGNTKGGSSAVEEEAKDVQIPAKELLKATDYDVEKYVTLNNYSGMEIELDSDYAVSDDDVKSYIEQVISMYPAYEKTDKQTVENKDVVNIDYEGKVDGETFSGGSATGAHLEIGSKSFIDGFEDGLIGKKVGEKTDLNLKFPDEYNNNPDLAGKDVVFSVTINSIDKAYDMTYDKMTDEYVAENFASSGILTVDSMKDQIRSSLENQANSQKQSELQQKILAKLEEECKVEFPEGLLDKRISEYKTKVNDAVTESGQKFEDYIGMTEEEFDKQLEEDMRQNLTQEMILEAIVQKEDISISSNEFEAFVDSYVSSYGLESEDALYEQFGEKPYIQLSYAENQALTKIMNEAKVTVKAAEDDAAESKSE